MVSLLSLSGATLSSTACDTIGSVTIANVPGANVNVFQVNSLGSKGQLTGFYYGPSTPNAHAFFYNGGAVTDLGTLGGSISEGLVVNSSGTVAGDSYLTNFQFHAFLYNGGGLQDLGTLGGTYSSPYAINDAGEIVGGSSILGDAAQQAFLFANGALSSLGTLGGTYSLAFAINQTGAVAGESSLPNGDIHAFIDLAGVMTDLGTLGSNYSSAFAINDAGAAAGQSLLANGQTHGFYYASNVMTDLGTLGGTYSSAFTLNRNGQVIGVANVANDAATHGFIYLNGAMTDLGTLGGTATTPLAINNHGQVVGYSSLSNGMTHAFLWQNGNFVDLNSLLPAGSGWELDYAQFINDAGRVVGTGVSNGVSQPFILDLVAANNPPVAFAGPNQTLECGSQVTLDGSKSSDPDGDALTFQWTLAGNVLGTNSTLSLSLPMGTNVITLTVTDTCGASSQTNVSVVLRDTTPPTGSCPGPVQASSDANCQAPVPNVLSQVIASDNCTPTGSLTLTQSPTAGTMVGLGPHPITVTVTDASGNSSTCSVLFTVADTTAPVFISVPASFTLSADANCQAAVPNILGGVVATDNCTPANQIVLTQNPTAGTVIGSGSHSILVTATDAAGNHSSATVAFQVVDTTAPAFLSQPAPITVAADATCQAAVPNVLGLVQVADNCTPANQLVLSQNPAAGTVLPKGQYTVTVTATDAAGNSASQPISLTIADLTAPVIQSLSVSPNLLTPPNHALIPVTVSILATDNCDPAPVNQIIGITCSDPTLAGEIQITGPLTATLAATKSPTGGTRVYTLTVQSRDASGNSSTGTVTVSVPYNQSQKKF